MKTGIIEFILSGVGSKSEKMQPFLREADGNLVEIFKEGDNPFKNESLKQYEGKTVTVTGEENEYGLFIIDTVELAEEAKEAAAEAETEEKAAIEIIAEEKTSETNEKAPETEEKAVEEAEAPMPKEVPTAPFKGFKKFLAFFHRK